ncbi:MAG: hypothetical protein WDA15_05085 [Trueperaceae bacterium]
MKLRKTLFATALMSALALGVWGLAVSFTTFNFSDGDTLSAAGLNSALNDNFSAAETAINALEAKVAELEGMRATLPIAYGWVSGDGSNISGSGNFEVVNHNPATGRYDISIDDESIYYQSDYTMVTATDDTGNYATVASVSGNLLVYLYDADGNPTSGGFNFVTFKRP